MNQELQVTQYQEKIGEEISVKQDKEDNEIDILMENMGRVNYGHKLLADTQRKGIRSGVMSDLHYVINWEQYGLDFSRIEKLDFSRKWEPRVPAFYRFSFDLNKIQDTNIDLSQFGKGVVIINGFNLGRFWQRGPQHSLYLPHGILRRKNNQIIIFETEGQFSEELNLIKAPLK